MPKVPDLPPPVATLAAAEVLARRWFPDGAKAEPLPAGGFSGSPLVLLRPHGQAAHVLKAFAPSTSVERAGWIHAVMGHVRAEGIAAVPAVRPLAAGGTLAVTAEGRLWEAVALVAGEAVDPPRAGQMAAAMQALAAIHAAAASLRGQPPAQAPSRGLGDRVARARVMLGTPWRALLAGGLSVPGHLAAALRQRLALAAECFAAGAGERILRGLARFEPPALPCQVVLRDVWSEHVLFAREMPDRIAGIVDFHAAGFDTPATDLARLLGSWLPAAPTVDPGWWEAALASYETVRPLRPAVHRLVPALAASGILFGLDHWFRWTLVEQKPFPCPDRVIRRIDQLLERLPAALNSLAEHGPPWGLTGEKCSS